MARNPTVERALSSERAAPSDPSTAALASRQCATKEPAVLAIRNLSVLAYAQGFTLWHYRAGAARLAETQAPGFFDAAADMFAVGDMVMISAADGGTIVCVAATGQRVMLAPLASATPAPVALAA